MKTDNTTRFIKMVTREEAIKQVATKLKNLYGIKSKAQNDTIFFGKKENIELEITPSNNYTSSFLNYRESNIKFVYKYGEKNRVVRGLRNFDIMTSKYNQLFKKYKIVEDTTNDIIEVIKYNKKLDKEKKKHIKETFKDLTTDIDYLKIKIEPTEYNIQKIETTKYDVFLNTYNSNYKEYYLLEKDIKQTDLKKILTHIKKINEILDKDKK